jgi:SAM-dependent methyltransferase
VTVTARGLLLTRDLCVQQGEEEVYDAVVGGFRLPLWSHDTCLGGLGLDASTIAASKGARVLDVASGLAIFGTELSVLGAAVDCVDLEIDDAHPSFELVRTEVRSRYPEQLALLSRLAQDATSERYAMNADELALLDRLVADAASITDTYPALSGKRIQDDARTLDKLDDNTYDLVTCGWLMVHLEPDDERRTLESLLRVAKPGGRVHIRAGYGGQLADRIHAWKPDASIALAHDDLVVLVA